MSDFDKWYAVYPRKVAKLSARNAYDRIVKKNLATEEQLLDGAIRYAHERMDQDPQYTKHPASWLNAGCWDDQPGHSSPIHNQPSAPSGAPSDAELRAKYGRTDREDNVVELRPEGRRVRQEGRN